MGNKWYHDLERPIDRRNFMKFLGATGGSMILAAACGKLPTGNKNDITNNSGDPSPIPTDYSLKNLKEHTLISGFERPTGLSVSRGGGIAGRVMTFGKTGGKGIRANFQQIQSGDNVQGVFCSGPRFVYPPMQGNINFTAKPSVLKYSGTFDQILNAQPVDQSALYEFTNVDAEDFWTTLGSNLVIDGITTIRPRGLVLETVLLKNKIVSSSTVSKRLREVDDFGNQTVFLENDELIGISGMTRGSDGKVYAVQIPIVSNEGIYSGNPLAIRPKRVISIDSNAKTINLEVEISNFINGTIFPWIRNNSTYPDASLVINEQLKIAENPLYDGTDITKTRFYVSDLLGQTIYKVSGDKNVAKLKSGLRYPSSLAVDNQGIIYVTLSPVLSNDQKSIVYYPELLKIDPSALETAKIMHTFSGTLEKYLGAGYFKQIPEGLLPEGFTTDSSILENSTDWLYQMTDNLDGSVKMLSAKKVPTE